MTLVSSGAFSSFSRISRAIASRVTQSSPAGGAIQKRTRDSSDSSVRNGNVERSRATAATKVDDFTAWALRTVILARLLDCDFVTTALEHPWTTPPVPGTTLSVAPGVRWVRMPLPFALDHINLWLLRDGKGWTAVDCGIAADATRVHWEQIFRDVVGNTGLTRVLVTHFHPDHFGNAGWLTQRFDAPLWMSESEYLNAHAQYQTQAGFGSDATARLFAEHGLDLERVAAIKGRGNSYRKIVSEPPTRFVRMMDGDKIDIGGNNWRVIVGWGHAPEHAALYCESLGVLISGDMLLPRISTNISVMASTPHADPLGLFLDSIDGFRALPADTLVLPSHGRPFRGLHARVDQLHAHHAERCEVLIAACAGTPKHAAELISVLFNRDIPDPHQTMFAMGEAIAHLNYLEHSGKMQRIEENGLVRFIS